MKSKCKAVGLVGLLLCLNAPAENPPDAGRDDILTRVIELAEKHALNAQHVDWPAVSSTASELLRRDDSDAGLSSAVRYVLNSLKDRHSFYRPVQSKTVAGGAEEKRNPDIAALSTSPSGTPILAVNSWAGREVAEAATDVRQELIKALDGEPCGIILNFAENSGGNMWPMVTGLLPLFSEGTIGGFEGRDGATSIVSTGTGLLLGGSEHFLNNLELPQPSSKPTHIALIIGDRTASSGEITAVLFKGQAEVRYFGKPTAGVPTANRTFKLDNGAMLALTTAVTIDRNGNRYIEAISPDVETEAPIQAAESWISSSCSSRRAP